jgi:heme-degrading monooxygenase HmoA
MSGFMEALEPINAIADATPGFVWRLQDEAGDATAIRPFEDESLMINMSVWESREALWRFVYDSEHLAVMRRRREWFARMKVFMALWWIPAGTVPTLEDARERLAALEARGPTPYAFTFKKPFSPVGVETLPGLTAELSLCD